MAEIKPDRCSLCGSQVRTATSDEGTSYYVPAVTDEMVSQAEDLLYERSRNIDPPWPSSDDVRAALEAALGGP